MIGPPKGAAVAPNALPLPLWQRLLITLVTMLLTSFVSGLVWHWLFNADIPSYLSGLIGGITAVPVWELLKRLALR
jgi:ABC-type sugar transport system permease subunit